MHNCVEPPALPEVTALSPMQVLGVAYGSCRWHLSMGMHPNTDHSGRESCTRFQPHGSCCFCENVDPSQAGYHL